MSVPSDKHCNAKKRNGTLCRNGAGARTTHLGAGRCWLHDKGSQKRISHGWTSIIEHKHLSEIMDELSNADFNTMDLIPEANLLRALAIDFINRYEIFQTALLAWYADPTNKARPRRAMDIADASHLIEAISRVVQRMHQIQSEGAISLETFRRVTEHMGMIVAKHVKKPDVLNKIEAEWMDLALDAKPSAPSTPVK